MENTVETDQSLYMTQNPPKSSKTSVFSLLLILPLCACVALLSGLATYFLTKASNKASSAQQIISSQSLSPSIHEGPDSTGINIVKINGLSPLDISDPRDPYFSYQLSFGQRYTATSDEMLTDFRSQGGSAPPRLILSTGLQPLSTGTEQVSPWQLVEDNGNDCIIVWSTSGFTSFDDWNNLQGKSFQVVSEKPYTSKNHRFDLRTVKDETGKEKFQALVKFPEDITYLFTTCNTANQSDLETVLETFDVRGKF